MSYYFLSGTFFISTFRSLHLLSFSNKEKKQKKNSGEIIEAKEPYHSNTQIVTRTHVPDTLPIDVTKSNKYTVQSLTANTINGQTTRKCHRSK